jgi:hypothetical protein
MRQQQEDQHRRVVVIGVVERGAGGVVGQHAPDRHHV